MALQEVYRQVILDHYRNPRHRQPLSDADASSEGSNPLCGDEVKVQLQLREGRVNAISVTGKGCSISQSSASLMGEAVAGHPISEVLGLSDRFQGLMQVPPDSSENGYADLGDLIALAGVRRYPVRIKCATLPWITLEQALENS
ncbi:MAG: SUF system NifU family Fe-S cluster assembly protein [Actinomycetia bacterium]|nr:SUF system NifU family Fe-S cluster assembly protein [Actinomycetes bacterium]